MGDIIASIIALAVLVLAIWFAVEAFRRFRKEQKKADFQKVKPTIIDEINRLPKNLSDRVDFGASVIEPDEEDDETGED